MTDVLNTSGFTGSESFHRWMRTGFKYTEGVHHVAEAAEAYWLIDAIMSHQLDPKAKREEFQVWTLSVAADHTASLVMSDGNSKRAVIRQDIEWTDFPQPKMEMWLADRTLYLPSEH